VLAPAQLEEVWLASVLFKEDMDFSWGDRPGLRYEVDADTTIDDFHLNDDGTETHAIACLHASLTWFDEERDDSPTTGPFDLNVDVRGLFVWDSTALEESAAHAWLDYNATNLLWPYLRGYVAAITAHSRLPKLTIYTMSVPESPDFEESEDSVQIADE
jgi:hypothetical protein